MKQEDIRQYLEKFISRNEEKIKNIFFTAMCRFAITDSGQWKDKAAKNLALKISDHFRAALYSASFNNSVDIFQNLVEKNLQTITGDAVLDILGLFIENYSKQNKVSFTEAFYHFLREIISLDGNSNLLTIGCFNQKKEISEVTLKANEIFKLPDTASRFVARFPRYLNSLSEWCLERDQEQNKKHKEFLDRSFYNSFIFHNEQVYAVLLSFIAFGIAIYLDILPLAVNFFKEYVFIFGVGDPLVLSVMTAIFLQVFMYLYLTTANVQIDKKHAQEKLERVADAKQSIQKFGEQLKNHIKIELNQITSSTSNLSGLSLVVHLRESNSANDFTHSAIMKRLKEIARKTKTVGTPDDRANNNNQPTVQKPPSFSWFNGKIDTNMTHCVRKVINTKRLYILECESFLEQENPKVADNAIEKLITNIKYPFFKNPNAHAGIVLALNLKVNEDSNIYFVDSEKWTDPIDYKVKAAQNEEALCITHKESNAKNEVGTLLIPAKIVVHEENGNIENIDPIKAGNLDTNQFKLQPL